MKTYIGNVSLALALLAGVYPTAAQGPAAFPIADHGAASQAGMFAAFDGTDYLVGIQGDGTTNYTDISAQLVSTNGTPVGSRILTGRTGGIPYVASGGANFLLVWSDDALVAGGGNDQLYAQFVSRSGALVGSAFTFGPTSEEQDMQAGAGSLVAFDGRNYLAVWDTGGFHDSPGGDIHGALFSQTGSLVVPVIPVTSEGTGALSPAVSFGKSNYLVVWNNAVPGTPELPELYDIYGEFISTDGTQGNPFVISQTPTPSYNPCCAAFDGTNFMVVWNKNIGSASPNTVWNLFGRLVSPDGTFPGDERAMVPDANNPQFPSLAFDGANYLLAWNEGIRANHSQIVFQRFNPAASSIGPKFNLFSPQGASAPLWGGVLFDGNRFEITAVVGGATGIGSEGAEFTSGTGTYGTFLSKSTPSPVAAGSLRVTLSPAAANTAGARWQVDGGAEQISAITLANVSVGSHIVSFMPIAGWLTPANQTVTVKNGATTTAIGVYKPLPPQSAVLVLETNGYGTLKHGAWPQELVIGNEYTVTAAPNPGNLFSNWVGGTAQPYPVLSALASYTFTMQYNLVLQANFVPNPFIPEQGAFNGLFLDTNDVTEASSGFFSLALTKSGTFTGKIMTSGSTYSLPTATPFDLAGQVEFTLATKHNTLTFTLQLNISDPASQQITGTVSSAAWTAALAADRGVFSPTTNKAANYQGQYTLAIAGSEDAALSPGGFGCATLSINSAGLITMAGNLADGTAMSQSVSVSKGGRWPFYVPYAPPPTGNGGAVFGWLTFSNQPASALGGTLYWFRPAGKTPTVYPGGFTNTVPVIGSAYSPADQPPLALTNAQVTLDSGNLPFAITNQITLSSNGAITVPPPNTNKLALTLSKTTGAITGTFANPSNPKQTIKINGVLLQNRTNAAGYFLGANQSGAFLLENP